MQDSNDEIPGNGAKLVRIKAKTGQVQRMTSDESEGRELKKARASKPKVRSGCITCKVRRVKCDERKPGCFRCEKFGGVCDGYANMGNKRKEVTIAPYIPSIPPPPPVSPHRREEEHRYFEIFRTRTAFELSGYYDNPFWHDLVQKESYHHDAIRHAVIALGAINMSMDIAPPPDLKVNIIQALDRRHFTNAVQSYQNAVQCLNYYINSGEAQLRVTLIACLLFICFETIQGSFASSVGQTYGGLKILRNYFVGKPGSRRWIPSRAKKALLNTAGAKSNAERISRKILSRLGCDGVSKQAAMVMHVEDYLAGDHEDPPLVIRERKPFLEQSPGANLPEFPAIQAMPPQGEIWGSRIEVFDWQTKVAAPLPVEKARQPPDGSMISESVFSGSPSTLRKLSISTGSGSPALVSPTTLTPATMSPPAISPVSHSATKASLSPSASSKEVVSKKRKRATASPAASPIQPRLQNDEEIDECIFQSFVRLDGQGLFFGMVPGIPPLVWDIHSSWHLPIPPTFTDFRSAQRCWDFLQDRCLQFYRRTFFNKFYQPANSQSEQEIASQHAIYLSQIQDFEVAFAPFLATAIAPNGRIVNPAALVMSLYQILTKIMLARISNDSEMVYDAYLPDFRTIISIASLIISSQEHIRLPLNPRFSFDVGIVPPLHVTATRCRDPVVRREAIALLFKSPRQEGMWDGVVSARVGCWLVRQEEEGLPPPSLPPGLEVGTARDMTSRNSYAFPAHQTVAQSRANNINMMRISEVVNSEKDHKLGGSVALVFDRGGNGGGEGGYREREREWFVPEANRVQLMVVDFHVPKRYIQIKCAKVLPGVDGTKKQMETVIGW